MRLFLLTNVQITSLVSEHLPLLFLRFEFSISVPSDVDLALGFGFFAVSSEIHNHISQYIFRNIPQYISIYLLCAKIHKHFTCRSIRFSTSPDIYIVVVLLHLLLTSGQSWKFFLSSSPPSLQQPGPSSTC